MVSTKQTTAPADAPSPEITEDSVDTDAEETSASEEPMEISKDDLFHVLQNERRRRVLTYLLHRDGPFEMRSIAEQVAAWEHDTTVRQLMSDERQRVYIALYQSHLPKLDEVGLINYEQNRGVVEPTALLETVSQYIDPPEDEETVTTEDPSRNADVDAGDADARGIANEFETSIDHEHVYMGVAAISFLLTGGAWLQSIPFSGLEVAMVLTGLFGLAAGAVSWLDA